MVSYSDRGEHSNKENSSLSIAQYYRDKQGILLHIVTREPRHLLGNCNYCYEVLERGSHNGS